MNSIYDQVAKNPFHAKEISKTTDTGSFVGLKDKFYIRKATGITKRDKYTNIWKVTDYGEKMLLKYRKKFLPLSEDSTSGT
jgi:hypothetical protein